MNWSLDKDSFFAVDVSRAEELLRIVEEGMASCLGKNRKWQDRQLAHAGQLLEKVIRNRDIFPAQITVTELIERGLFDLEWEGMVRASPRFVEIIEDMECMDLSTEKDAIASDAERRSHIDLLHEMAGRWWTHPRS